MEAHLSENEIAQFVDALVLDNQDQLHEEIREHVAECYECKVEIVEVLEVVQPICPDPNETVPTAVIDGEKF